MFFSIRPVAIFATALALAGCTSLSRERGYSDTQELIAARRDAAPRVEWADAAPESPSAPISADDAVQLAFFNNPRIREQYARLGLGRAELEDARRLGNPSFGYGSLSPKNGSGSQITRSVSLGLTDLLLLSARKRFAEGDLERLQKSVANALLELASEVETAWYEAVSAQQVATMRSLVADAADSSAQMAQRLLDAGNISRLQLAQEMASAAQERIDAVRSGADALRARSRLAGLIGLPSAGHWRTQSDLPAPLSASMDAEALLALALENRLDLAAAQQAVALREDALAMTRRWRWLGSLEVGAERETEFDGGVLRGPSLALELPLFNQGQGSISRAQAELLQAHAELDAVRLSVQNDAQLGIDTLIVMADIAERYRRALVPQREIIVAESQKEVNFMLIGVFELLAAKQQEYDAYQEYLEAVRDFWIARAELRRAVGGRLPDDDVPREPAVGVEAILPAQGAKIDKAMGTDMQDMEGMDHSSHGAMSHPPTKDESKPTPMPADEPAPASSADPHAGHRISPPAKQADKELPGAHDHHGDTP